MDSQGDVLGTLAIKMDGETYEGKIANNSECSVTAYVKNSAGSYELSETRYPCVEETILTSPNGSILTCDAHLGDPTGYTNSGFTGHCVHEDGRKFYL